MSKRVISPFTLGPVRLRLLQESDLQLTLRWRNQEHIRRWFFHSEELTPEQHWRWYEQYRDRDDDFVFIIEELQAASRPVGQVAIYHIDWVKQEAEFGRLMIGEASAAGKGLAYWATRAAVQIAFDILDLQLLYLEVFRQNQRAIHIYEKAGFVTESQAEPFEVLRMTIYRSGQA